MTTSERDLLLAHRPRKTIHTYSLTVHGGAFHLTTTASTPPYNATARCSPSLLAHKSFKADEDSSPSLNEPSTSRLYVPPPPVLHGARRNLYLFRPTAADIAKEEKRDMAKAASIQEAKKAQEEDERRRNVMLGITVPRKSTRIKAKAGPPISVVAVEESQLVLPAEKKHHKRRTTQKSTTAASSSSPTSCPVSVSFPVASPTTSSLISHGTTPSIQRQRRKPRPKVNPRPTERLTTRSLAKVKTPSGVGGSDQGMTSASATASEAGECEGMDVDVEVPEEVISEVSCASSSALLQEYSEGTQNESTTVSAAAAGAMPLKPLTLSEEVSVTTAIFPPTYTQGTSKDAPLASIILHELHERNRNGESVLSLRPPLPSRTSSAIIGRRPSPLSQTHMVDGDTEDINSSVSSSGEVHSSDTLCEVEGNTSHDIKKELMADRAIDSIVLFHTNLPPPPQSVLSLSCTGPPGHTSVSPASTNSSSISSISSPLSNNMGKKRSLGEIDGNPNDPLQPERRRSGRVVKKRKVQ